MLYITIFTTAGAMYLWITLPLTVLILLGGIIKIGVPKEDVILKVITENHNILFSARSSSTTPPTVRCSVSFLANSIQQKY